MDNWQGVLYQLLEIGKHQNVSNPQVKPNAMITQTMMIFNDKHNVPNATEMSSQYKASMLNFAK